MKALKEVVLCIKLLILFYQRCSQLHYMSLEDKLNSNRLRDNFMNDGWSSFCVENYIIDWQGFEVKELE